MVFSLPNHCLYPVTGLIFIYIFLTACSTSDNQDSLFRKVSSKTTGITFQNNLTYNKELNPYTYRNFYNGGGVGIGDFNNDGRQDIFLTGNQVSNKLYLNEGGLSFKDISRQAGIEAPGVWSTGVSVVDINGDGWLDIYVCKSGKPEDKNRANQLFINNGDSTFTDKAKAYGLDIAQLSIDATFFDYDRDGDLDMYLLNNSFQPVTDIEQKKGLRNRYNPEGGNKLFRNETISSANKGSSDFASPPFVEVTRQAGIYSSNIGFGLDVLVGDLNKDDWPDMYVANDFFERDYLYLNNKDGSFEEVLPQAMQSVSLSSMGGDIADINHDGRPEIFISDMLPGQMDRFKSKTVFDSWEEYKERIEQGYHYQYTYNTLQLNNGPINIEEDEKMDLQFNEISRLAGVDATDWSWTALFADFNNDGSNDLFISNGIFKDLNDQDYLSNNQTLRKVRSIVEEDQPVNILFDDIPSVPLSNYIFAGSDSLSFTDKAEKWGLGEPGFSNGAAYSDLDNDGDLDLVLNNVNSEASIYENRSGRLRSDQKYIAVQLNGSGYNPQGIGAKVTAYINGKQYYREQMPNRGFQSSIDPRIFIGLGPNDRVDSLIIRWPDDRQSVLKEVKANQLVEVKQARAVPREMKRPLSKPFLKEVTDQISLQYKHEENNYNAFSRNPMLYAMHSQEGPASCVADVNEDGKDDLYLGGAKGQSGRLYIQGSDKTFSETNAPVFEADKQSEDTHCVWFDADGNETLDLYVASGSSEFPSSSSALADRLYLNEGSSFRRATNALPQSQFEVTSVVKADDIDNDNDIDLFTGSRLAPFAYGVPVDGHILLNNGKGQFRDISKKHAPVLIDIGMITDAGWTDFDRDGDPDLVVAGEWMPIRLFQNQYSESGESSFKDISDKAGFSNSSGLWKSLTIADLDNDGFDDIFAGNYGTNSTFSASPDKPLKLWVNDFDQNGSIESILSVSERGKDRPLILKNDLVKQMPLFAQRIEDYKAFAAMGMKDLFTDKEREESDILFVNELQNVIFWNEKGQQFNKQLLRQKAQIAPVFDAAKIGSNTLIAGGNISDVKPIIGAMRAGYGTTLKISKGRDVEVMDYQDSGFYVEGEIRAIHAVKMDTDVFYMIVRNDRGPVWFKKR